MKALKRWGRGVRVKNLGEMSKTKKARRSKSEKGIDTCLTCKEHKCNKGTCNKFKR